MKQKKNTLYTYTCTVYIQYINVYWGGSIFNAKKKIKITNILYLIHLKTECTTTTTSTTVATTLRLFSHFYLSDL